MHRLSRDSKCASRSQLRSRVCLVSGCSDTWSCTIIKGISRGESFGFLFELTTTFRHIATFRRVSFHLNHSLRFIFLNLGCSSLFSSLSQQFSDCQRLITVITISCALWRMHSLKMFLKLLTSTLLLL